MVASMGARGRQVVPNALLALVESGLLCGACRILCDLSRVASWSLAGVTQAAAFSLWDQILAIVQRNRSQAGEVT